MQHQLFHEVIEKADALYNNKVALITAGSSFSFTELNEYANGLAYQFKERGIEEGDRVVIALGNTVETIIAFWATLKTGAIACPIGLDVAVKKLDYIMQDSGAKLCLNQESLHQFNWRHAKQERPTLVRISSDLASILYTSGSTGEPKGVMLSHENMLAALLSLNTYLQYRQEDKVVCVSPLSFDYGLYQMLMSISQGAELHLFKNLLLPTSLLKSIEKNKLTILPGVPTLYSILFEHSSLGYFDLSSIRMVTNTGAAMTLRHINMTKALFPQAQIFSMYGLTECKRCTYLPPYDLDRKPNSVGIAIPHTSIWIADERGKSLPVNQVGQLIVEGKTVMQGYWNKPEATQQKIPHKPGQLFTGDYGYLDEEGYFYFVGRMDDMLKCRGQKVSPKELEDILIQMDGVKEVAVIGVPDTDESDAIYLHIAPFAKNGLSEVEIREYCLSHLSSHQQPKKIILHEALPKNENGKINKQILKHPQSLSDLVRNTIAKYPERQALCIEGKSYTYNDLDQKAKQCALALSGAEGEVCALFCPRGEGLYIGLLASLYAGYAYMPVSTRIPSGRTKVMLEESKAKLVILDHQAEAVFQNLLIEYMQPLKIILYGFNEKPTWTDQAVQHQFVLIDEALESDFVPVAVSSSSPACLLFTSGSTGIPKGVMISHGNLLAYYHNGLEVYKPSLEDRFIQVTELTFDLSMHDIFLSWGVGAQLFSVPDSFYGSLSFYSKVLKFVDANQLTFWMSVPSIGSISNELELLKKGQMPSLKCTVFCGEPLSSNMAGAWQKAAPHSKIFNLYGPTEATIGFTYFEYHSGIAKGCTVPIGKPFPTEQTVILNDRLEPLLLGQTGELYLGGEQVVQGYLHNPSKTQERFIEISVNGKKRMWYRTGDLAYLDEAGDLQYVGRIDDQIKIRGSRVEKLEIENLLRKIAATDAVAVVPWPLAEDGTVLGVVAFMSGLKKATEVILKEAKVEMPEYMIPKEIHILEKLPLNQNGKVDYKALRGKLAGD